MSAKQNAGGMKSPVRQIAFTALLLALCIAVQQFKTLSQFITGPAVNAIVILSVLWVGLWSGLAIAVLSPVLAFLIAPMPVLQAAPLLLPLIMLGHTALAVCIRLGYKRLPAGLAAGVVLKPLVLFLGVRFIILPLLAANTPDQITAALKTMFSVNQLITAAIGGALAYLADKSISLRKALLQ